MRVLITGITGFAGSHLAEYLLGRGDVEVFGTYRWRSRMDNLEGLRGRVNLIDPGVSSAKLLKGAIVPGKVNLVGADITDLSSMRRLIEGVEPEGIFHLAAQSYVPASWNAPHDTLETNILGELNLLEAVREAGISPRIQVAGSSEEYGLVQEWELPITEANELRPLSPYAVSKVTQEKLAYQYHKSFGMQLIVTRGFNHEGPRRGEVFVTSNFAKQIAEVERGLREPVIRVGDLSSQRDWTDVRDMVRAYWLALERCEAGEAYNIGTGVRRRVREMLETLLGMSSERIRVEEDPTRLRPSDVKVLECDASKFRAQTGWESTIPFEQTMRDLLDYWRQRLAGRS